MFKSCNFWGKKKPNTEGEHADDKSWNELHAETGGRRGRGRARVRWGTEPSLLSLQDFSNLMLATATKKWWATSGVPIQLGARV